MASRPTDTIVDARITPEEARAVLAAIEEGTCGGYYPDWSVVGSDGVRRRNPAAIVAQMRGASEGPELSHKTLIDSELDGWSEEDCAISMQAVEDIAAAHEQTEFARCGMLTDGRPGRCPWMYAIESPSYVEYLFSLLAGPPHDERDHGAE